MGGPIVRTGTTPKFWQNWEHAFGGKKAGKQAAKEGSAKTAKGAKSAKKTSAKAAAGKKAKKTARKK
jgi:hypothetical protein